jgi:hypothetical protein
MRSFRLGITSGQTPTGKDSAERNRPDFQAQAVILVFILIFIGLFGHTITPSGQAHPSSRPSGRTDRQTCSRGGEGDLGWEEGCQVGRLSRWAGG